MTIQQAAALAEVWVQELHANPEGSFCEYKTTAFIRRICGELGVETIDCGLETGVLAWLDNGCAETVALRADIDAVSFDNGPRHQCGHDYHTASLLGAIAYLKAHQTELRYNVACIFQCAEENIAGARAMVDAGLWERFPQRPTAVFGIHNRPELPVGTIGVHAGALMATKADFRLVIRGRQGHGSTPEKCIDPILPAAEFTAELPSLVSHELSPFEPAVCSVYSFHSGTDTNAAPLRATLTGSIRALRREVHQLLKERVESLAKATAESNRCHVEELTWYQDIPLLDNSTALYSRARAAAAATVGEEYVTDVMPCLGGEDFAVFMEDIPGFYYWVGSGKGGDAPVHAWHSDGFSVAEGYLPVAVALLVNLVV
ncbi:MAG: amidohydrolase [Oscillospiraceae bacterium]|nr:amidohydrolase [Oscillospiraceae bacterium]